MLWIAGAVSLVLAGLLMAAERERRRLRWERARIVHLVSCGTDPRGPKAALHAVVGEVLASFGATRALLAVKQGPSSRLHVWEFTRHPEGGTAARPLAPELARESTFLATDAQRSLLVRRKRRSAPPAGVSLNDRGQALPWSPPDGLLADRGFRAAFGVSFGSSADCSGRLWLLDPARRHVSVSELAFLQAVVDQVAPVLQAPYVRQRLLRNAGAAERARVAHELHDGVVQSLISLEMRVSVLRRANGHCEGTARELDTIRHQLRDEVLNLRELMTQMRPLDVTPQQFVEFVAEQVDRFQRDTSIDATFISEVEDVRMPAGQCAQLARIVQEALVNVRKHSRARHVVVRFGRDNGTWKVTVDDDGRGFPFAGRLEQAALDACRKGPVVIKERVRSLGGALAIESHPERGARLEITVPH